MRQQAAAAVAARTGEQSKLTGDGSDMMPAIGTPVAANTSLGASLNSFTLPISASVARYRTCTTTICTALRYDTKRAIRLGTIAKNKTCSDQLLIIVRDAIRIA